MAAIFAELAENRPARQAFAEGRPTMEILRVRDWQEIARELMLSSWDCRALIKSAEGEAPKAGEPKNRGYL